MTIQPEFVGQPTDTRDVAYVRGSARVRVRAPRPANRLRRALVAVDVVAVASAWAITLSLPLGLRVPLAPRIVVVGALTVAAVALFAAQHLYLARVCGVRSVEVTRLAVSSAVLTGALAAALAVVGEPAVGGPVVGGFLMLAFTATGRSGYDAWLKTMRASGRYSRPIVLVGANDESLELAHLLRDHPEFGYAPVGVVGDSADRLRWTNGIPWLGGLDTAGEVVIGSGASGALLAASALSSDDLNRVTRDLLKRRIHVHVSSGLRGISHRRLRALPISHEPLFYLEPTSLPRWKYVVKRTLDFTFASVLLLLSLPLLVGAAIAIKLDDRGPIFYRQVRVGRDGRHFTLLKLRTMRVGADSEQQHLTAFNEREGGPLFKARHDPRRTRMGRFLEQSSIDEIPQLVNVLRGEMSVVGPRPALPEEVARFDRELWARHDVLPGVTGLWQVEARDNPSFTAYRRLDLFYVENWSVALDLAIVVATVQSVLSRLFRPQAS